MTHIQAACLATLVAALLSTPGLSQGSIVVSDDFEDDYLDPALWVANGPGTLTEQGGRAVSFHRGHLTSVGEFDPRVHDLILRGEVIWMSGSIPESAWWDISWRSEFGALGTSHEALSDADLSFYWGVMYLRGNPATGSSITDSAAISINQNDVVAFEIYDNGDSISATVNNLTNSQTVSLHVDLPLGGSHQYGHHVKFFGRDGWNCTVGMEWIEILHASDSDADGLYDHQEDQNSNGQVDPGETDPFDQDTDDDGLSDGEEVLTLRPDSRWLAGSNGNFYRLAPSGTWSKSSAAARAQGYELTSVQGEAEALWLYDTFGDVGDGFWIGLNDFGGTFEWSDGNPFVYDRWASTEPDPANSPGGVFVGGPSSPEPGYWYTDLYGSTPRLAVWEAPGPDAPTTALDPLEFDTDGDGLGDGQEGGLDSIIWDGGGIPGVTGTDPLVFIPDADPATTTDPLDLDSDEDGLEDGTEDLDADGAQGVTETDAANADSDDDGLPDGLELGLTSGTLDTNGAIFVPDADPLTTTDPLAADTDLGGVEDGVEDQNIDGAVNSWETNPNNGGDESLAFYVSNLSPGQRVHFEVYNGTPGLWIFPAYSIRGSGPTSTTIGISVDLTPPITTLPPAILDANGRAGFNGPKVPSSVPLGFPVYWQAIEFVISPTVMPRASNPIQLPVGAF